MDRPAIDVRDHSEFDALVVRTDYDHPDAWAAIRQELARPMDIPEADPPNPLVVDDPAWAGASWEEVIAALSVPSGEERPSVVLLADSIAMTSETHQLLAVDVDRLLDPEEDDDEPDGEELEDDEAWDGREAPLVGRVSASQAESMAVNLALANMDFDEFIEAEA
ncbi:hypothetical protein LWF15_30620 [Kineosporia rhizophila]|uniref:DUF6924 domain-containing protein n=1 Tax=Kineosporia TaxID=49184 RepID=UPI001E4801D0|nr:MULTISPECIES: hypothetical protein [Kineosporia]MCE0539858.1 hypothetical protein [Kineosporia rhizophila]GLY19760.1 hypothetical protein Kisp01_67740 [Kineosporia sp. NBRC 101677]